VALSDGRAYLMATPGKALADKLRETRGQYYAPTFKTE
jgi:hypothetical protein